MWSPRDVQADNSNRKTGSIQVKCWQHRGAVISGQLKPQVRRILKLRLHSHEIVYACNYHCYGQWQYYALKHRQYKCLMMTMLAQLPRGNKQSYREDLHRDLFTMSIVADRIVLSRKYTGMQYKYENALIQ